MYLATWTAPGLHFMSLPEREKFWARAPSTLKTTASVCGGTMNTLHPAVV